MSYTRIPIHKKIEQRAQGPPSSLAILFWALAVAALAMFVQSGITTP